MTSRKAFHAIYSEGLLVLCLQSGLFDSEQLEGIW